MVSMSAAVGKPVGLLSCQQQPFLKELDTCVVSCAERPDKDGLYEVELEDTVIFPEGGGQPSDVGTIDGIEVVRAKREGLRAVHYAVVPVEAGKRVRVAVDFARRLDHMQQHSGQHLLSAILEQELGLETVSWSLGAAVSHVELKTSKDFVLGQEMIDQVEERCNKIILEGVPVAVRVFDQTDEECPSSVPDDYVGGVIRYVDIGDKGAVDSNACCGTHVSNTAQLQLLKLGGTDRIRGGNTRLFFYVGGRVRKYAQGAIARDRQLTELLSCPPDDHCEAVDRVVKQSKASLKSLKSLRRQLAPLVASDLCKQLSGEAAASNGSGGSLKTVCYHCEDGDGPFVVSVVNEVCRLMQHGSSSIGWLAIVASGARSEGGPLAVAGSSEEAISEAVGKLSALLGECKGGAKRGVWQGKAASFNKLSKFAV
ncbi:hypothetical protein GGI12_003082 [Dipsacomyces acuminosporus]|nr:hypothetical protein GGI12_003082 [Dipsacomyces acuminosporus]